jgi:DNA-binding NtrC family response regulator
LERFFLVLVDLVLGNKSKLDGLEIVRAIKRRNPETSVMVMTAYGSLEVKHKALAAGASSYWDKPLNLEKLLEEIHRLESNESTSRI